MLMKAQLSRRSTRQAGFALAMVMVGILILAVISIGVLTISYGVRLQAIKVKTETKAMLAAEAGYEKGVFWMSQQGDILSGLQDDSSGSAGTIDFGSSSCNYAVQFEDFIGARPVFKVTATGISGTSSRAVDVYVMQAVSGWDMGMCRIPLGTTSTTEVYFADGEIIDIPIHINNLRDNPDNRDIYIKGSPRFRQKVGMGESRETKGGTDKYAGIMGLFNEGIYFDQPDVRVTDEVAVSKKVERFRDSTDPYFRFTPVGDASVTNPKNAVQLEFFVEAGVGKVRITNNCTVSGYPGNVYDYNIVSGSGGKTYHKYDIYAYHYAPRDQVPVVVPVENTYVRQDFGGKESEPGGQIFVNGNVVIGGSSTTDPCMVVKGKMTVVATGNIWIADSIVVDGLHDANGMPKPDNPNVLGLIAQGVVKIVDPNLSNKSDPNNVKGRLAPLKLHDYKPIANADGALLNKRALPHNMVVEAAVTVGGGGWGAENVRSTGGRKVTGPGKQDFLILRGTICECVRGIVGIINTNGYLKQYYLDKRLQEGILPGNIWFGGKYVPAPAGWHDYRPTD